MENIKIDIDNIEKAKDLLWSYCEKCDFHAMNRCSRQDGVCEIDEAWSYLDMSYHK